MQGEMTEAAFRATGHLLVDVGYGVHPAADAHLVPHVRRVTELVDDADVVGVGTTEQLLLQCQRVHLWEMFKERAWIGGKNALELERSCLGTYVLKSWADLKI